MTPSATPLVTDGDHAGEPAAPLLAAVSAGVVAFVLQWTNGMYRPFAVVLVTVAWVVALVALFGRLRVPRGSLGIALGLILATSFGLLVTEPPTQDLVRSDATLRAFACLVVFAAFGAGMGLSNPGFLSRAFPVIVGLHVILGALVIRMAPSPKIDVWSIEMEAARALVHGENPFAMTFVDIYGGTSKFFPPGVSVDGRLQFGFVYPPLSLLLCIPGYLLGGDTRWSMLVAMGLAALLVGHCRPGTTPKLAALVLLFTPRTFFVMDRAWTDAFVVLLTAAICFCALRRPRWLFLPLGLYVCLKQHMFIGIPALFLLLPRPIPWKFAGALTLKAAAVAAVVTLPMVLWNWHAFARSVLDIREVFRTDSLGLIALLHNTGTVTLSKWAGLVAIVPVAAFGYLRAPRTPAGFALLAGVTHFTLYVWSTHSFCNEYYNVFGALCCAVGAWGPPEEALTPGSRGS